PDTDQRQLSWLAERIGLWQSAALEVASARAALEAAHARFRESLSDTATTLGAYDHDGLDSTASIAGAIEDLERRSDEHASAVARAEEARRRIDDRDRTRAETEHECEELLLRLG